MIYLVLFTKKHKAASSKFHRVKAIQFLIFLLFNKLLLCYFFLFQDGAALVAACCSSSHYFLYFAAYKSLGFDLRNRDTIELKHILVLLLFSFFHSGVSESCHQLIGLSNSILWDAEAEGDVGERQMQSQDT